MPVETKDATEGKNIFFIMRKCLYLTTRKTCFIHYECHSECKQFLNNQIINTNP